MADVPQVSGSLLTRKLGPLPTWGWMGVGLGGVLIWRWSSARKDAAAAADTTTTPTAGYKLPSNIPPQFTDVFSGNYNINSGNVTTTGTPAAAPVPGPIAPDGRYITVTKYQRGDTRRTGIPSTLWGISQLAYSNGQLWASIWNDPKNADLKARRGDPSHIQPGDQVWVSNTAPAGGGTDVTPSDTSAPAHTIRPRRGDFHAGRARGHH